MTLLTIFRRQSKITTVATVAGRDFALPRWLKPEMRETTNPKQSFWSKLSLIIV